MGALTIAVLLRLSAPCVGAASFSDAKDNIETIIQTYAANKSPDGYWAVKSLRLRLKSVETRTIQRTDADLFKAAAAFTDERSNKLYFAEFVVDFGGTDWHVAGMKWITRAQKDELVKAASESSTKESDQIAAAAARRSATAAKRAALPPETPKLPKLFLPAFGSMDPVSLDSCLTGKCLTVYLTPWCPHCKNATANILSLKAYLAKNGVETRIVVGDDSEAAILQYAETLGAGTLLDGGKQFKFDGGVPHVFVSEDGGRIIKETSGFQGTPAPPASLAEAFGLP